VAAVASGLGIGVTFTCPYIRHLHHKYGTYGKFTTRHGFLDINSYISSAVIRSCIRCSPLSNSLGEHIYSTCAMQQNNSVFQYVACFEGQDKLKMCSGSCIETGDHNAYRFDLAGD
jgi:hypothetical protein